MIDRLRQMAIFAKTIDHGSFRGAANDAPALFRLARAGAGLAIVPDFLTDEDVARGAIEYVLPGWTLQTITVFAVWPSNAPKHGLIHLALDALDQTET